MSGVEKARDELRAAQAARSLIASDIERSSMRLGRAQRHVRELEGDLEAILEAERDRVRREAEAIVAWAHSDGEVSRSDSPTSAREARMVRLDAEEQLAAARQALASLDAAHVALLEDHMQADAGVRNAAEAVAAAEADAMAVECLRMSVEAARLKRRLMAYGAQAMHGRDTSGAGLIVEQALTFEPDNLDVRHGPGPYTSFWQANTEAWLAFGSALESDANALLVLPEGDWPLFPSKPIEQVVVPMTPYAPRIEPGKFTTLFPGGALEAPNGRVA